ncbi:MAG: penicillin-binding protein 2 [Saccharospirillum sp.]
MNNGSLNNREQERRLFMRRMSVAFVILAVLVLILVSRLAFLQLVDNARHEAQSERNRLEVLPIPPIRGLIYDRNGELLAHNLPSYTLSVVVERTPDLDALFDQLSGMIELNDQHINRFHQRLSSYRRPFEPIPLKLRLNEEEIAVLAANRVFLEGIHVEAELIRQYPYANAFSHVLGFVGRINEAELEGLDRGLYAGTRFVGKQGVERQYEEALLGKPGFQRVETNARGRILRVIEKQAPQPGADLQLFLDRRLQEKAVELLGDQKGAIVVIDTETGGILSLVSQPGFDPNLYVSGFPAALFNEMRDSEDNPFLNRAIRGLYPPASTLKPIMGLGAIDGGVIGWSDRILDPGWFQLPNDDNIFYNWKRGGHGRVNMVEAVAESSDVYFYELGYQMTVDRIHDIYDRFGFGKVTTADVFNPAAGINPSRDWKRQRHGFSWYAGDTINLSIGQGYMLVTPMQVAIATAVMANKGRWVTPRLLKDSSDPSLLEAIPAPPPDVELGSQADWDRMHDAMVEVVHGAKGTARGIGFDASYQIAGKTGTAQVIRIQRDAEGEPIGEVPERFMDHAWFMGFAPAEDPEIAITVLVENGGGGSRVAAPIARELMDFYLLRRDI